MYKALARTAVLVAALGAATPRLHAQTIRGQVIDSVTRGPVGTGFVVLIGGDGRELARALTSADGRFAFTLTRLQQGPFRLRSERIGFGVSESDAFDRDAATTPVTLFVGALPTPLANIEVREATECRVRPAEDERTAVVWEEARKALAAASWTASRELFHIVSTVYRRTLETRRRRVLRETHSPSIGNTSAPFVSVDPAKLLESGYVAREGEDIAYYAPDAEVLQDEGFLETHCFRLRSHDDRDELIGLAFEPAPSRRLPDVRGVLWLDRERSELRSIEYEYTNLPPDLRSTTIGYGRLQFMPLPSGAWIVHEWIIGIPTEIREERISAFDREPTRTAQQIRDVGGEVLRIENADGSVAYQAPLAELTGVVVDRFDGDPVPLAGAVVQIADTWFADTTDLDGRFRIGAPLNGDYTVTLTHPRTESWGVMLPVREVELARNRTVELTLEMPPLGDVMEDLCPGHPTGAYNRILVGWVRHFGGDIAPDVQVAASWQRLQSLTPPIQFRNLSDVVRTDARGHYALCGLETTRPTMVYAVTGDSRSEMVRVAFEETWIEVGNESFQTDAKIWRHDFVLHPNRDMTTTVTGAITDASTGELISGAVVTLVATGDSVMADRTGVFRFEGLAAGTHDIIISHPGYTARTGTIVVYADQPTIISSEYLTLVPVPQVRGQVHEIDSDAPVAGAVATLVAANGRAVSMTRTDSTGAFVLTASAPGEYQVAVRRIGYMPTTSSTVQLTTGRAVELAFPLFSLGTTLAPITVTGEAASTVLSRWGFYERQQGVGGVFLDRAAIEERAGATELGHLLQGTTGVRVDSNGRVRLRGIGCDGSPPLVYVDGVRLYDKYSVEERIAGSGVPSAEEWQRAIHPIHVEGIELYRSPAEIPAQYNTGGDAACGVILVWTRRGGN